MGSAGGEGGGSGKRVGNRQSPDPTDSLIRDLIDTGRPATSLEIQQIRERLATAVFDPRMRDIPPQLRGRTINGQVLGDRGDSLLLHLAQRIDEGQWSEFTTREEYLEDLHQAAKQERARLLIYQRRGGAIAAVLAETALEASRRGSNTRTYLFVAYSADRGILVTGYQIRQIHEIALPEVVRWLA